MLFYCLCTDKPNALALRMATRPDHLKFLEGAKSKIVIAGPILSEDGQTMLGSMYVFDMENRAAVEAHVAQDPYAKAGLFESVVIRPFRKAIPS